MDTALVPTALVPLLLAAIERAGGNVDDTRKLFGLSEPLPTSIPEALLRRLANHAAKLSGDPFLGLHLGASHRRGLHGAFELGALELVCSAAPTLGAFFERLVQNAFLIRSGTEIAIVHDGHQVRLERAVHNRPDAHTGRHLSEFILATLVQILRFVSAGQLHIERVWLPRKRCSDVAPLARFFGTADIVLEADLLGIAFPAAQLALPCVTSDPALVPVLDDYARFLLSKVPQRGVGPLAGLHDAMRVLLREGDVTVRGVAAKLAMSPRTLQRKLAEEGTSFQEVLDGVRRKLAAHYLKELALTPDQVAVRLGYSEPRAFFRAYKRWTGETPRGRRPLIVGAERPTDWHDPSLRVERTPS